MTIRPVALLVVAALSPGTVFATNPPPQNFLMMGLGWGQTLRLNAVASDPQPVGGTGCVATLSFADIAGSVYNNPPPKDINLAPGQATFLDFPANLVVTVFGQHATIRPMATFPGAGGPTDCVFAAELIDQGSGFSSVFQYPQPANLPGSTVSFSLMGVAFLQMVRVYVVYPQQSPPSQAGPCGVSFGFMDANGHYIGAPAPAAGIYPGSAGYTDLPASSLGLWQFGQRAEVRPVVTVQPEAGLPPCLGVQSLAETFDVITGRTWAASQPQSPNGVPQP